MKQKYISPEAKITLWENEVFLQTSGDVSEQNDNLFGWVW